MMTKITVQPAREPVSLQDAKDHLNLTHDLDDALVEVLIQSARERVEKHTGRALITQTRQLVLGAFENSMLLPYPPLQSVDSIAYVDTAGTAQTLAAAVFDEDTTGEPGRVLLAYEQSWPEARSQFNAVTITYKAGYGDNAQDVPAPIRSAMLLIIGHLYENREETIVGTIIDNIPMGVEYLLAPYQIHQL